MKTTLIFAALFALCAPLAGHAADRPAIETTATPAAEKFQVGPMLVERYGNRGTPMIFIPGLSSGPYVWDDAVRRFGTEHVMYLVTLPGFNGHPATSGDLIAGADKWIGELIVSRKLVKPVLVGHSLGATLSIAYAGKHPEQLGGVVAIDGLPVFPGMDKLTPGQRAGAAAGMKASMSGMTAATFGAQQKAFMHSAMGVMDDAKADVLATRSAQSDPAAVVEFMSQIVAQDFRAPLAGMNVPVLLIAPYHEADMKAAGFAMSAQDKVGYYTSLMGGAPRLTVVPVSPARHFAMIDQPQQVADAIGAFLKTL